MLDDKKCYEEVYDCSENLVNVLGIMWNPPSVGAKTYEINYEDIMLMMDEHGDISRERFEAWLKRASRKDFDKVGDYQVLLNGTFVNWQHSESESIYNDTIGYEEVDGNA